MDDSQVDAQTTWLPVLLMENRIVHGLTDQAHLAKGSKGSCHFDP